MSKTKTIILVTVAVLVLGSIITAIVMSSKRKAAMDANILGNNVYAQGSLATNLKASDKLIGALTGTGQIEGIGSIFKKK